jgi:Zn-dependent protease
MSLIVFLVFFAFLLVAMTIHEFAHSWMAYKLGDLAAKYSGRLTFNPLAHIDIFWTVILPLLFFFSTGFFIAAAKPVPINYWALRNPKKDMALIGLAGPASNIILALVLATIYKIVPVSGILGLIIIKFIYINLMLGFFNLIPIPPLDGSRIMAGLLPENLTSSYISLEPYGFAIIILLSWLGLLSFVIHPVRIILSWFAIPFN